ncbi:hypothetical protein D9M68_779010 [compost metagenome]
MFHFIAAGQFKFMQGLTVFQQQCLIFIISLQFFGQLLNLFFQFCSLLISLHTYRNNAVISREAKQVLVEKAQCGIIGFLHIA